MSKRSMIAALLLGASFGALADHLPPAAHQSHWQRTDRSFHNMSPAQNVRALREAPAERRSARIVESAGALLNSGPVFALLLLERGEIVFEGYANKSSAETRFTSMSTAKSMTALALGEALCAGKVRNLDDKAGTYSPLIADTAYGRSSVRNLLTMRSGAYDSVHPTMGLVESDYMLVATGRMSMLEYLRKYGAQASRFGTPIQEGEIFRYKGLDTEAIAFVVEGATGMPMHRWFEQSVWAKAGAEAPGHWQLDKEGRPVAETVFIATARDYARIGLYVLAHLDATSGDACMSSYLKEATRASTQGTGFGLPAYGYQIWIASNGTPWFLGHGGQMLGFDARTGRLLVTLGNKTNIRGFTEMFDAWNGT